MVLRRPWAFVFAGAAVAVFIVGFVFALAPPEPDCGEGTDVYCEGATYDRIRFTILGSWIGGTLLLGAAIYVLLRSKHAPPPPPKTRRPSRTRAPPPPTHTPDGRRVVTAKRPPATEPRRNGR